MYVSFLFSSYWIDKKNNTMYSVSYFCCRRPLHSPVYSHVGICLLFYRMVGHNDHRCCCNSYRMFRHYILQLKKNCNFFSNWHFHIHPYTTILYKWDIVVWKHFHTPSWTMLTVENKKYSGSKYPYFFLCGKNILRSV